MPLNLRYLALRNYSVHGPLHRPVQRPVQRPVHCPMHRPVYRIMCERRNTPLKHPIPSKPNATCRQHTKGTYKGHTRRQPHTPTAPRACFCLTSHWFTCRSAPERALTGARARVGNASRACQPSAIWRKASGEKISHSNEPFAQSDSKQQTNLDGQCVRQMLQNLRQNFRFANK